MLVKSREGYQNLCRLITRMKLRAPRKGEGHIEREDLAGLHAGLICLTGGEEGPLAAALASGGLSQGTGCVRQLGGFFGGKKVYFELQRPYWVAGRAARLDAGEVAPELSLALLAT